MHSIFVSVRRYAFAFLAGLGKRAAACSRSAAVRFAIESAQPAAGFILLSAFIGTGQLVVELLLFSVRAASAASHANDFLVIGTVFTDKAYALPGARIRVRRTGEKKFRWDTYTNSRGEFAFRVPQGGEYEIVIIAKGFADQNQTVSAKSGISEDTVVYRMQPASGGKK